jgi:hypothetical protein
MGKSPSTKKGQDIMKAGAQYAQRYNKNTEAANRLLGAQVAESLQTGGAPGAAIPAVQHSVQQELAAIARADAATKESLGAVNMEATPHGQAIMAQTRLAGQQRLGAIGPKIAAQYAGIAPNLMTSGIGLVQPGSGVAKAQMASQAQAQAGTAVGIGSAAGAGVAALAAAPQISAGIAAVIAAL